MDEHTLERFNMAINALKFSDKQREFCEHMFHAMYIKCKNPDKLSIFWDEEDEEMEFSDGDTGISIYFPQIN